MSLVKISLNDLAEGQPLAFDVVTQNNQLILPKGTVLTKAAILKYSESDTFANSALFEGDAEDFKSPVKKTSVETDSANTLATMDLGKEIESFFLLMKEDTGFRLYPCQYIGWIKDLALVVEMPRTGHGTGAKYYQLEPGQKVQAKLYGGKFEYVFQSFVMCVTNNPLPHAYIKHPNRVKSVVRRQSNRKNVDLKARINLNGDFYHVHLVDLSDTGAGFMCDMQEINSALKLLELQLVINGKEQLTEIPFTVKNSRASQNRYRHGIEFSEMAAKDRIFLQSFIYTL